MVQKIQSALHAHSVLDKAQHGCQHGKGTSSASMIHINGFEDAEELCHELHRTSYDMNKAFDSVSKPSMLLACLRLGVPLEVAAWFVAMDINPTTVVKMPHSLYIWEQLMYHSFCMPVKKTFGLYHSDEG